jgi:hypothetical protein
MKKKPGHGFVVDMIEAGRRCKEVSQEYRRISPVGDGIGWNEADLIRGIDMCSISGAPIAREKDPAKIKVIESWADGNPRDKFSPKQRETIDKYAEEVKPVFSKYRKLDREG